MLTMAFLKEDAAVVSFFSRHLELLLFFLRHSCCSLPRMRRPAAQQRIILLHLAAQKSSRSRCSWLVAKITPSSCFHRTQDASTGSVLLEVGEHPAKHRIAVTISETAPGFATVPKYGAASCAHRSCVFVTPGASAAAPKIAPAQAAPPGSPTAGRASKVQRVTRSAASARPVSIPAAPAAAPSPPQQQPPPFPPPSPHSPAAGAAAAAGAPFPSPGAPPSAPPALPAVSLRLCARSLSLHDECAEVLSLAASGGLPTSAVRRVYHLQNPALYEKYVRGLQYAATVSSAQAWPPAGAKRRERNALFAACLRRACCGGRGGGQAVSAPPAAAVAWPSAPPFFA